LSYSSFLYFDLKPGKTTLEAGEPLEISVRVKNLGPRDGFEAVQLYLADLESSVRVPTRQLAGFSRVRLAVGETKTVSFVIEAKQMALIDERGKRMLEPGRFRAYVGGRQPDPRSEALAGTVVLEAEFEVRGTTLPLPY
jgi:beta-glucosidase